MKNVFYRQTDYQTVSPLKRCVDASKKGIHPVFHRLPPRRLFFSPDSPRLRRINGTRLLVLSLHCRSRASVQSSLFRLSLSPREAFSCSGDVRDAASASPLSLRQTRRATNDGAAAAERGRRRGKRWRRSGRTGDGNSPRISSLTEH